MEESDWYQSGTEGEEILNYITALFESFKEEIEGDFTPLFSSHTDK